MIDHVQRALVQDLFHTGLSAADPAQAVTAHLRLEQDTLFVGTRAYNLAGARLVVIGAGKATGTMAAATEALLGERITAGWVNVRQGYDPGVPMRRIHVHVAGHPIPDEASVAGTQQILDLLPGLEDDDLVLILLSGGASALLELPVPGVGLEEVQRLTNVLLRSGATIAEVNTVRKHLSQVKGGQLARWAGPAQVAVLVLSDVVGSPLDVIGSGPCAPDPTTYADAWDVLEHYGLVEALPVDVRAHLTRGRRGEVAETVKPGDPALARVVHTIIADNTVAAHAVVRRAQELGYQALLLTTSLEGEAREVGRVLAALAKQVACYDVLLTLGSLAQAEAASGDRFAGQGLAANGAPLGWPAVLVCGGETTVTVRGPGRGGRNQELALAAALALEGWPDILVATLATDGTDGSTDAAGAIVTGDTASRARALGLNPAAHLVLNDSYPLFAALGDLIQTGPTGTNVNDLALLMVGDRAIKR